MEKIPSYTQIKMKILELWIPETGDNIYSPAMADLYELINFQKLWKPAVKSLIPWNQSEDIFTWNSANATNQAFCFYLPIFGEAIVKYLPAHLDGGWD